MPNLLIVDDEQSILDALSMLLSDMGHKIDAAATGEDAMNYVKSKSYDLILADVHLPGMDGFSFLQEVRRVRSETVPFVFMTGYKDASTSSRLINERVNGLIYKPFDMKMVEKIISQSVGVDNISARQFENIVRQTKKVGTDQPGVGSESLPEKGNGSTLEKNEWEMFQRLGDSIFEAKTIQAMGEQCIRVLYENLGCREASMVVINRHRTEIKHHIHLDKTGRMGAEMPAFNEAVIRWMAENNRAILIADLTKNIENPFASASMGTGSLMAIPIRRHQCVLGLMILYHDKCGGFDSSAVAMADIAAKLLYGRIENMEFYSDLKQYFNGTIRTIMSLVKLMDADLYNHCGRVGRLVLKMARKMALSEVETRRLEYVTLLHDIGKLGAGTGDQTDKGEHAVKGEEILESLSFISDGGTIVRHHHEMFDGTGTPDGLIGAAIPLFSRVITVADAYDHAVQTEANMEKIISSLRDRAGKDFDPQVVELFIRVMEEDRLSVEKKGKEELHDC